MKVLFRPFITILCLMSFLAKAEIAFYEPVNLSFTSGHAFAPSIEVGSGGEVYVAWHDNDPGNQDVYFAKSIDNGKTYTPPINVTENTGNSSFVDIAVAGNGFIFLAWADNTDGESDIYLSFSRDGGDSFETPINLTRSSVNSVAAKLAVDSRGRVYILWSEDNTISLGRMDRINQMTLMGVLGEGNNARLAIDGRDLVHVSYQATDDDGMKQVFYTQSRDQGRTFLPPFSVSLSSLSPTAPALDVSDDGNVYIIWSDLPDENSNTDLYWVVSSNAGRNFSEPKNLTQNSGVSVFNDVYADANGKVHVAWNDTSAGNYETMYAYSDDEGVSFSEPANITPSEFGSLKAQVAADSEGWVHVASDDNRFDSVFEAVVASGIDGIPTFADISVSTPVLSPNNDGTDDVIEFDASISEALLWRVTIIEDDTGRTMKSFSDLGDTVSIVWDGLDIRNNIVPDGSYTVSFEGLSSSQLEAVKQSASFSVNTTSAEAAPEVVFYDAEDQFSPNEDGRQEIGIIDFEFNKSVDWLYEVFTSGSELVVSFSGTGTIGNVTWDGKDINSDVVPDATYTTLLTGTDSLGQVVTHEGEILIDTVAPEYGNLVIAPDPFSPDGDGIDDATTISLEITADSLVTVYILQSDSVGLVKELDRTFHHEDKTLELQWDGTTDGGVVVSPGEYQISIWIRDNASNRVEPYPIKTLVTVE